MRMKNKEIFYINISLELLAWTSYVIDLQVVVDLDLEAVVVVVAEAAFRPHTDFRPCLNFSKTLAIFKKKKNSE